MSRFINTLAELAAKQKLVPFMGAGCSASMLPDWDTITGEMKEYLGLKRGNDNLEIAQTYVETIGRVKFCDFLKNKLEISEFDDEKGYIHLSIMNMGVPVIYTTNQDNVMEKGYEKYGREYKKIIQLKDFSEIKLSEQLYIKFHGDLNYPESIVFTTEDYQKRMDEPQNALNIRLRADLLAKNLLFVGYSFRDINIQQMFAELQNAFYGELPKSYLIAYKFSKELQLVCDEYGIELINPLIEFPEAENHVEAFNTFLRSMLEEARIKKVDEEIKKFFTPADHRPIKVISKQELEILEKAVKEKTFTVGIELFREICDASNIPLDYENRIVNIFINLAKKVETDKDTNALNSAIFNLKLNNPLNRLEIVAALMATANVRSPKDKYGTDTFFISTKYSRAEYFIVLAAKAIENIYSWGWKPTPPLSWNVNNWIDRSSDISTLPEQAQKYILCWIDKMRNDCRTVAEHPIKRQQRLQSLHSLPKDCLKDEEIKLLCELINLKI